MTAKKPPSGDRFTPPPSPTQSGYLSDIRKWIRHGTEIDRSEPSATEWNTVNVAAWRDHVGEAFAQLHRLQNGKPDILGDIERLQMLSLEAEYYDLIGHEKEADETIRRHPGVAKGIFDESPSYPKGSLERSKWIRQIAWIHMEYAWVCLYRRGEHSQALRYLKEVKEYINENLGEESHGTLARYYYYVGHCERSLRKFGESHNSFKEAQSHAQMRYFVRRKDRSAEDERRFAVVCTARLLGAGLAWNAIHQGQLGHAQNLCLSALTLLADTGQEPFRELIYANYHIARRRATGLDSSEPLEDLRSLHKLYKTHNGTLGQLRCGTEVIRGELDLLMFGNVKGAERNSLVANIEADLKEMASVARDAMDQGWRLKVELLSLRFNAVRPSSFDRDRMWAKLEELERQYGSADPAVLAETRILRGMIEALAGNHHPAIKAFRSALDLVVDDPVIEAECRLRMADAHVTADDYASARAELTAWTKAEPRIENAYLHQFAKAIVEKVDKAFAPFVLRLDDDLNVDRCENQLRSWLARAAAQRAQKMGLGQSGKAIAGILGIDASSWSRWRSKIR